MTLCSLMLFDVGFGHSRGVKRHIKMKLIKLQGSGLGQAQTVGSQSSCGRALRLAWLMSLPRCGLGPGHSPMAEVSRLWWPTLLDTLMRFSRRTMRALEMLF